MIMEGLAHHAAREMPKVVPAVAVVATSEFWAVPWQQIGYMLGALLVVLQGSYTVYKWIREVRESRKKAVPKPTVPPAHGP